MLLVNALTIGIVQAILFLAPLMFNQMLEEDPTVNRVVGNDFSTSMYAHFMPGGLPVVVEDCLSD
jgi:hypothetical protein